MFGTRFSQGMGAVILASLTIWQHLNRLLMEDGDNRASLDPNG